MENDQDKLGCKLTGYQLDILVHAIRYKLWSDASAGQYIRKSYEDLERLFNQLRKEGERGGYDEWIIQEIIP